MTLVGGGNSSLLRSVVPELQFEVGVRVAVANYWDFALPFIAEWRTSPPGGIDHACELETSLMLAVREELVRMDRARDHVWSPHSEFVSGDLLFGAPVTVSWNVADLSGDGVLGSPEAASQSKGEALLAEFVAGLSSFVEEFARWDWELPNEI